MADEASDTRLTKFLAALKARSTGDAPPLPELTPVRQIECSADLCGLFAHHATQAGMGVRSCRLAELTDVLIAELRNAPADSAILAIDGPTRLASEISGAAAVLNAAGVRLLQPSDDEAWFSAAAGITTVRCAVAETGSLVIASGVPTPRSASLIPPIHVALVAASQIVPDLVDALASFNPHALPAGVVLITGPSKTADIEGVLVTGVHGPGRVIVLLVVDA